MNSKTKILILATFMATILVFMYWIGTVHAFNNGGSYPDTADKPLTPVGSQHTPEYWDGQVDRHVLNMKDVEADKTVHVRKARGVVDNLTEKGRQNYSEGQDFDSVPIVVSAHNADGSRPIKASPCPSVTFTACFEDGSGCREWCGE